MNDLVNPLQAHIVSELLSDIGPDNSCYALVDCAFNPELIKTLRKLDSISIYQDTELAEMAPYTPRLYLLPERDAGLVMQLVELCQGQPMLSFVASNLGLSSLKQHFEYLLKVYCEDNSEWPLRFADTRIAISLLATLNKAQKELLLAPIYTWWVPDRQGQLHAELGQNLLEEDWLPSADLLQMDEAQFTSMLDAAQADSILATLRDQYRPMLAPHNAYEQFVHVERAMIDAEEMKLASHGEVLQLAAVHLMAAEKPSLSADYGALKVRVKNGMNLADASAQLPATFWR